MLLLTGDSLNKRHKELNGKINEAFKKNVKLDEIEVAADDTDIDRLFKIGLASKYKDYLYIVEVLKSGDALCISNALKCYWIYDDDFSHIIEPEYLHSNVFPFMSNKMKNKTLYTISKFARSEKRAQSFYMYCKAHEMYNISYKFLIFCSESFKLETMKAHKSIVTHRKGYFQKFIGNSFPLANAYLECLFERMRNRYINELFYLYDVSSEKFLDMLEKYHCSSTWQCNPFNARQSEDIMKNHRERFNTNYQFYFHKLNFDVLAKYISVDEAKDFVISYTRNSSIFFSHGNPLDCLSLLRLLPSNGRFQFFKKLYMDMYGKEIEMDYEFYEQNYYTIMTVEEREIWALRHLESGEENFGKGKNYIWYKFIHIDKSLPELKKYMLVATKSEERLYILYCLIKCARSVEDVEKVLNYYYERHVNEDVADKEKFLDRVLKIHNVYDFDEKCWTALERILCSMDLYDTNGKVKCKSEYRDIAVIHHLLNSKNIPAGLSQYMDSYLNITDLRAKSKTLGTENDTIIYKELTNYYVNKLKQQTEGVSDVKKKKIFVSRITDLLQNFNKTANDCPDIVLDYVKQDPHFKTNKLFAVVDNFNQEMLIRKLKQDTNDFLGDLENVKQRIYNSGRFDLRKLLRKLKIFFKDDIAKVYLKLFEDTLIPLNESQKNYKRVIYSAVYGIFQLADTNYLEDFMIKHAPSKRRLEYIESDPDLLFTQYAICRCSCFARPPLPLSTTLLYIREDYLQYCSSTLSWFLANFTPTLRLDFIVALLHNPSSIQIHALNLLFSCFTPDYINYVLTAWDQAEDVDIRKVLYTKLFDILLHIETEQDKIYECLLSFTVDLHKDDRDEIFNLLSSNRMLEKYSAQYLTSAWLTVDKLPMCDRFVTIRSNIIKAIENRIDILNKEFLSSIMEKHVKTIARDKYILLFNIEKYSWEPDFDEQDPLSKCTTEQINVIKYNTHKWKLVKTFIKKFDDKESVEISLKLVKLMMEQLFPIWNEVFSDIYFVRKFFVKFITDLRSTAFDVNQNLPNIDLVFETILQEMQKCLPMYNIYLLVWELKLILIGRKVLHSGKPDVLDRQNYREAIKMCEHYGKEIGNLILDLKDKKQFYKCFMNEICDVIWDSVYRFLGSLPQSETQIGFYEAYVVHVYNSLVEFDVPELHLITLKFLRKYRDCNYTGILQKIDECEDDEVCHYSCNKFMFNKYY